jgi:signal transduction histidine kinase
MFDTILAKLSFLTRRAGRPNRVSILLPFAIISIAIGALAWRSYTLSIRTEGGAKSLAVQYARFAAEISARRLDAALASRFTSASDQWQQVERRDGDPTFDDLREWSSTYDWIIATAYIPDHDPSSALFFQKAAGASQDLLDREFFTSTGTVHYKYDPRRLIQQAQDGLEAQPLTPGRPARWLSIRQEADISLVTGKAPGLEKLTDGFAFVAPLGGTLAQFGIRAAVPTEYVGGTGWQNQRVVSLWVSLAALVLMAIGAVLALRGINKESETMKLRGALIANVSHELRTPLSMIRLGAETLQRGKLNENERKEIEQQILREVLLLSHMVENVLDVARIQNRNTKALAFTPVQPRELIQTLLATYDSWIRSRGFTVKVNLDETIQSQMWDRDAVSRALLNLIDNAIKYSDDLKEIEIVLRKSAEHVVVEVKDRGVGIEAKDVSHLFEPYYRARFSDTSTRRGAGLGLTLVHQILTSHGGRVEIESAPGAGSTFRLLFPIELQGHAPHVTAIAKPSEAF